jgi:hypothetical protein
VRTVDDVRRFGPDSDDDAEARRAQQQAERRAEWRRFVREHHPDNGGDPAVFDHGVRLYRAGRRPFAAIDGRAADLAAQHLTTHRTPRGLGHVTRWARRRWEGWTRPPRVQ